MSGAEAIATENNRRRDGTGAAWSRGLNAWLAQKLTVALLGFAALLALPLQAQAQTDVWSTTLTPRTTYSGTPVPLGCDNTSTGNRRCSNSNTLSADTFTDDGTTYTVTKFFTRDGVLTFRLDTSATAATQGLTLVIAGEEFVFAEADQINGAKTQWKWNNTTLGWTEGTDVAVSLVVNDAPATGQPTISGGGQVGKTLTAVTDDIEDLNGLPATPTFSYQWVRVDGFTDTDIPGATSKTYTLTASDLGKQIKVKVSFTDARGHAEGPLTSDAYPPNGTVADLPGPCPAVNDWCALVTAAVDGGAHGYEFDKFGSIDDNMIEYGGKDIEVWTVYVTPQPLRGLSSIYLGTIPRVPRGTVITLGELSYTTDMESEDGGDGDLWEFPEFGFPPDLVWSDGQEVRVSIVLGSFPAEGAVTISGTARKGLMLTADVSNISDPDGLTNNPIYTYQWVRVDGTTETDIPGATEDSYTPVADDVGKQVKLRVSFTDDRAHPEAVTSEAYPPSGSIGDSTIRSLSETFTFLTVQQAENIGDPVRVSSVEGIITYRLEGEDAGKFMISSSSGQLSTRVGERYDYEEKPSYTVTVNAVNQQGTSVSILVIINILDVVERPTQPVAPTVSATAGSITSLDVSWTAPENTGRPAITHYNLRYREDSVETWTDGPQNVTGTAAQITDLTVDTPYQVQVQAVNDEGSVWSGYGRGRTDAPTVSFRDSAYTTIEDVQDVTVTVELFPAASHDVTILLTATAQGGATAEDWSGVPESITFAAGDTSKTFTMTAESDSFDETGENVQLGFGTLPSGINLGSPSTARVALVDDTDVSTWFLFFEESSYTTIEGGTAAQVTVELSNPWKPELNESLTIGIYPPEHRGGADASDYSGVPERVTFLPGQTRVEFTVTATDDSFDDDGESIYLQFAGFDIDDLELDRGPRAATVHLRDDDGASAVQVFFDKQTYRVNEGSAVDVSVHLDKAPGRTLSIPITTAHGNGASSLDYSGVPGSITFSSSQYMQTFNVQVRTDNVNDVQEYLAIGFGELPASVSAGSPATTMLNLVDSVGSPSVRTISFDAQESNVRELLEGSMYSLYVYLDSATNNDIVVPLQVDNLDGATTADYSGLPETVIIRAGQRRQNVIIRVLEDTEDENGEGIRVRFGSLPSGISRNLQADTATFRFLDNDTQPAISIAGAYVQEWPNPQSYLRFVASLDYAPEFEVAVDYRTVNGSAVAGQDYESKSGTLTFAEGERSKDIRVLVCHDGINESMEEMTLQLFNPVRGNLQGSGSATGSIGNNNNSGARPCSTGISVSDVSYPEPNINHLRRQEMQFEVSLNQADTGTVTVDYQTVDGTATSDPADQDYESTSGTVTFRPGQTRKTVKVVVVADAHDDPDETFILRLSNPSGAYIGDGEGTATLTNSGPMPGAWLSRFGRVASDHAVQAIEARIYDSSGRGRENHLTIGGQSVDWQMLGRFAPSAPVQRGDHASPDGVAPRLDPWLGDQTARTRMDRLGANAMAVGGMADLDSGGNPVIDSLSDEGMTGVDSGRVRGSGGGDAKGTFRRAVMELLGLEDFSRLSEAGIGLKGSSFFYSRPGSDETPGWLGPWSMWGETAVTRFDGAEGLLSLKGDVTTATVGFDTRRERWMAGLVLAYSEGQGAYTHRNAAGGAMDSSLTSLIPFASYSLNERTSVWGMIGYGVGDLALTPEGATSGIETNLSTAMAAFGGRGVFSVHTAGAAQFEFAVRADARLTNNVSDAVVNLAGAAGATSRVRAVLEGRGSVPLAWGGDLSPRLEVGLRYDDGDAETGAGLEIGGGLGYATGNLSVEVSARGLVAHEYTEYEEWGFSSSISYAPSRDGRGLSMRLGSAWGATQSGVQSLWNQQDASGLASNTEFEAAQRFQAELGYGIAGRRWNSLWVPFISVQAADGSGQAVRTGLKLTSGPNFEVGLELGRRQGHPVAGPDYAVQLQGRLRW